MNPVCPKCQQPVTQVSGTAIVINIVGTQPRKGLAYACMACNYVINCELDPLALKDEIVGQVEDIVRRNRHY